MVEDYNNAYEQCGSFTAFALLPVFFVRNILGPAGREFLEDVLFVIFGEVVDEILPEGEWC